MDSGTHNFVTTSLLPEVKHYLIRAFEGLVEEWDLSMIGECRRNIRLGFIVVETGQIGLNVLCGPFCDGVPERHDPCICLGKRQLRPTVIQG